MLSKRLLVLITLVDLFSYRTVTAVGNIRKSEGHAVCAFVACVRRMNK